MAIRVEWTGWNIQLKWPWIKQEANGANIEGMSGSLMPWLYRVSPKRFAPPISCRNPVDQNVSSHGQPNIITCKPLSCPAPWSPPTQKKHVRFQPPRNSTEKSRQIKIAFHSWPISLHHVRSYALLGYTQMSFFSLAFTQAAWHAWSISNLPATRWPKRPRSRGEVLGN
jgi:hypothetical protein